MRRMRAVRSGLFGLVTIVAGLCLMSVRAIPESGPWTVQTSGINTNLRGLSAVYSSSISHTPVVWASGSNGVILRSEDGGTKWKQLQVEDGDKLDFRGIEAIDGNTAYVMSSGSGEASRIYKTGNGGLTWALQYTDKRAAFFLDALVCSDSTHCFALSDPIDGKFVLVSTRDGATWKELPGDGMPDILPGEGVFAASGTALTIFKNKEIYFATGGGSAARVFHSPDMGHTWSVQSTPVTSGNASSGIFSVLRVGDTVVAVGGDYKNPKGATGVAAYSTDQGVSWELAEHQPGGFRSAVSMLDTKILVAVGPSGEDVSSDLGVHWTASGTLDLNTVCFLDKKNIWAAGSHGTVARYNSPQGR